MNNMMKKLRSDKGASITFGLLVFMVCAVLCSVIIVAATTTSGRLVNMSQADQRYYCVTSACGLLEELLDEKEVSIVEVDEDATYLVPDMDGAQAATSYTEDQQFDDTGDFTANTIQEDAAYRYYTNKPSDDDHPLLGTYEISSSKMGTGVNASIHERINSKGDIVFTVSNKSEGDQFAMVMTFTADVRKDHFEKESNDLPGDTPGEKIDTITMQWHLGEVKTVSETGAGQ